MNNSELARLVNLHIRKRGKIQGYSIGDAFFYDDEGNIAMIRVARDVVAVAHLYERVSRALKANGAEAMQLEEAPLVAD